eukprot:SAG11_NODE_3006_length_2773_cov_2.627524_3_plen_40_part_00
MLHHMASKKYQLAEGRAKRAGMSEAQRAKQKAKNDAKQV